jgi:peptide/nickel transport system permease protein
MFSYILRRMVVSLPLIFGVLTLTFFIIRLAPGDPTAFFIEPGVSPRVVEQMREQYGLNDPLPVQYVKWLGNVVQGDFGKSFSRQKPVFDVLTEALPITMTLAVLTIMLNFAGGILLGIISAVKQGTKLDRGLTVGALFFYSMPDFWFGLMSILIFCLALGWFPASNLNSVGVEFDWLDIDSVIDRAKHLILPVFVLSISGMAGLARYVRGSMLEVIRQDYVRTARAKGLAEKRVIFKHALRNALLPTVTIIGSSLPALFGGALVIETIFALPGVGRTTIDAIFSRDYPLIIAGTLISAVLIILGNLVSDVLYAVVDPRIKLD